jgi:hypothetical protein
VYAFEGLSRVPGGRSLGLQSESFLRVARYDPSYPRAAALCELSADLAPQAG